MTVAVAPEVPPVAVLPTFTVPENPPPAWNSSNPRLATVTAYVAAGAFANISIC